MAGPYRLGVDLGTTYTAAAIARDGRAEMCTLGERAASIPSVVLVRQDGDVLVGDAAQRRSATEPTRVAREFKRRLGDTAPLILGGVPYTPEVLMAHVLRHVVRHVSTLEDRPPDEVVLTHPANFGPYKLDLMREVARQADVSNIRLLPEPQAAALAYAQRASIEPGSTVAVYDFGGGTFDVALVRRAADGSFHLVGSPEGMDRLGGIDFDQAIMAKVVADVGLTDRLADADPTVLSALSDLRDRCREAKEALSTDVDAAIAVNLPGVQTNVRLTRTEFEELIRPRVVETIESLQRVIRNSGMASTDIDRVLLVGGSSRIPLVAESVRSITGRPVALDANPKNAICQGAALFEVPSASPAAAAGGAPPPPPPPPAPGVAPTAAPTVPLPTTPSAPTTPPPGSFVATPPATEPGRNKKVLIGVAAAAALLIGAIAVLATRGGDDPAAADTTGQAVDTTAQTTEPSIVETSPPSSSGVPTTTVAGPEIVTLDGEFLGREVTFGPVRYKILQARLSNSSPAFDDSSTFIGDWTLRLDVEETNVIDSGATGAFITVRLDLADGSQLQGRYTESQFVAADATVDAFADFTIGAEAPDSGFLEGATLLFGATDSVNAGIVLTGDEVPEAVPAAIALTGVSGEIEDAGLMRLDITEVSVTLNHLEIAPFGGTYETRGVRAAPGKIWVVVDTVVNCVDGGGGGCLLDLEDVRLDVDGVVAGVEEYRYYGDAVLSTGTSVELTVAYLVKPGSVYTLLLGVPSETIIPKDLPIAEDAKAVIDSVVTFNS